MQSSMERQIKVANTGCCLTSVLGATVHTLESTNNGHVKMFSEKQHVFEINGQIPSNPFFMHSRTGTQKRIFRSLKYQRFARVPGKSYISQHA
jgi:hypothetical protein